MGKYICNIFNKNENKNDFLKKTFSGINEGIANNK